MGGNYGWGRGRDKGRCVESQLTARGVVVGAPVAAAVAVVVAVAGTVTTANVGMSGVLCC